MLSPFGDSALHLQLGHTIDLALNQRVHAIAQQMQVASIPGITAILPGYATLVVQYDPLQLDYAQVAAWVGHHLSQAPAQTPAATAPYVEIPVRYGGPFGPDLPAVAAHCRLTEAQVIARHTAPLYHVYLMGFTPGFAYLGGLDPTLATPRLPTPRLRVPAGAVGIAGHQTGIYPLPSPGGWQLIGQTPLPLFDPAAQPPTRLQPGQPVRFVAV